MENHLSKSKTLSLRNKGILGQEILHIKNGDTVWSLQNKGHELRGRCSGWKEWKVLLNDFNGYFSFTTGVNDDLHISCKNNKGGLTYLCWSGEEVSVDELGDKWVEEERVTYQTVLVYKELIYIIYFTDNPLEETWKAKYCYKSNEQWSLPKIIDYGIGQGQSQGAAAIDRDGVIHLIYQIYSNSKYQFVYREKALEADDWNEKVTITDSARSNLYPCLVIDGERTLHLTWVRSDGMNYRVVYRRKTRGGWMVGGWQNEMVLSKPGLNAYNPTIAVINEEVTVIWQQTEGIFQSCSYDYGKTFNEPVLKRQYQKAVYNNLVALDMYKQLGVSTTETFDTGSTSVALLAALYNDNEQEELDFNLPDIQRSENFVLPSIEHLSLDYGQKDLEKHLNNMNGNVHRLFFETEDVRLTNMQMKETIQESSETIAALEKKVEAHKQELEKAKGKQKTLENTIEVLKKTIKDMNSEQKSVKKEKRKLEEKLRDLEQEKDQKEHNVKKEAAKNKKLEQRIEEKEKQISDTNKLKFLLEEEVDDLKRKIKEIQNQPIWRRILK